MSVVDSVRGMDEAKETLEAYNIDWEFGDIDLKDIDLARSLMWNAREDGTGLNDYWVDTYSLAYKNKEELPPIICMKSGPRSTKLLVLSGHHRVAGAKKAGRKTLPGFTTDTLSDPQRLYVTAESNRKVGYGMSEEARIEAALRFVRQGESAATAARTVGVSATKVTDRVTQMRADDRTQKLTSQWAQIHPAFRKRLYSISSDHLMKKACDLTLAAKLTSKEVHGLVKDINTAGTDLIREDIIATAWEIYRTRVESGGKDRATNHKEAGYLGVLRGSLGRIAAPKAFEKMDEIILHKSLQELEAAHAFTAEAVRRGGSRAAEPRVES
jgi:hypothetical protein